MEIPQTVKTEIGGWKKTNSSGAKSILESAQEGDFSSVARDIKKQISKVPKGVWIGLAITGVLAAGAIAYGVFSKAKKAGSSKGSKETKKSLH